VVNGDYGFAAGRNARALHHGAWVWNDGSTNATISSSSNYQFIARAAGGYWLYSNAAANTGVNLPPGSGGWNNLNDRNAKENFATVSGADLLRKLGTIPIQSGCRPKSNG
jgi:hypothetical protein